MPGKQNTKSLSQQMAEALKQSEKTKFVREVKQIECGIISVDYKLVRSTSETRKIDEHKYHMQLCMDTQTNKEKAAERQAVTKAREIMKTMINEQRSIKYELIHIKTIIERFQKLIRENPCDNTKLIEAEKARLRVELPSVVERHNASKVQERCAMAPIVQKDFVRTNVHQVIAKRQSQRPWSNAPHRC